MFDVVLVVIVSSFLNAMNIFSGTFLSVIPVLYFIISKNAGNFKIKAQQFSNGNYLQALTE